MHMLLSSTQVQVTDVADGCAASGLVLKGDTILSINGTPVTDEVQGRALARAAVGKVEFLLLRGDAQVSVSALKPEVATRLGVTMKNPENPVLSHENVKVRET
jgi:S1-C subfamily serine protease